MEDGAVGPEGNPSESQDDHVDITHSDINPTHTDLGHIDIPYIDLPLPHFDLPHWDSPRPYPDLPHDDDVPPHFDIDHDDAPHDDAPHDDAPHDDGPHDDAPFDDSPFDDSPADDVQPFDDRTTAGPVPEQSRDVILQVSQVMDRLVTVLQQRDAHYLAWQQQMVDRTNQALENLATAITQVIDQADSRLAALEARISRLEQSGRQP